VRSQPWWLCQRAMQSPSNARTFSHLFAVPCKCQDQRLYAHSAPSVWLSLSAPELAIQSATPALHHRTFSQRASAMTSCLIIPQHPRPFLSLAAFHSPLVVVVVVSRSCLSHIFASHSFARSSSDDLEPYEPQCSRRNHRRFSAFPLSTRTFSHLILLYRMFSHHILSPPLHRASHIFAFLHILASLRLASHIFASPHLQPTRLKI
jgi:hypothetical protein